MVIYSLLMFAAAILFFCFTVAIYRGNTDLIHAYHQTHVKVTDKKKYGESFSKGLLILTISLILSGMVSLFGTSTPVVIISISVLFVGMIVAFIVIAKVQKKFNGGFF